MKKYLILFAFVCFGAIAIAQPANAAGQCFNDTAATCTTSGALNQCRTCEVCDDASPSTCHSMQVCSACMTAAEMDKLATRRAICLCNHPNDYNTHCGNINASASAVIGGGSPEAAMAIGGTCKINTTPVDDTKFNYNGVDFDIK